jgi:uncharacterized membrane protein YqjE
MHDVRVDSHPRSLGEILSDISDEFKEFLNTRLQMVRSELHETLDAVRVAVPLGLVALVLVGTGFLLLTGAIVVLVAAAFAGHAYAWFFAFAIVGVLWIAFGGAAAFFAYNEFRSKSMFPTHTVEVLKADRIWLESEARTKNGRAA